AALQNIVGLKPTRGWLSTRGVVPVCRSLDCVSVFALTVEDASEIAAIAGAYDAADPFARPAPASFTDRDISSSKFRFGVPSEDQLEWFGDTHSSMCFDRTVRALEALGGVRVKVDFSPFRDAAKLLYDGPWVAERWSSVREFHARVPDAMLPVTLQIIESGSTALAVDAFEASYTLAALKRATDATWTHVDTLVLPTVATTYTRAQVDAEPIMLNSNLGCYTNFANLLDTAALAVPTGQRPDGLPFGITLFGPAWSDARLSVLGAALHRATNQSLGATGHTFPTSPTPVEKKSDDVLLAVVGAHLTGQPLNSQLTTLGAHLKFTTRTSDCYRFYALKNTSPAKPGLLQVPSKSGVAIEVEVWGVPLSGFGRFVAAVPPPLVIGTVILEDGSSVKGFLCESFAIEDAQDISKFGGWRAYVDATKNSG
ncbi:MAG TPA: allophanate hydrolase, partial [Opitutaceae bacterium]|nr:allophanate hydrolase [Opitutaceae bacterium]